jgi:two-component system, response regulator YesN
MIKVLIVDDDKLVRKGLISAMPWRDFGMEVVAEANNGQRAIEILERQPIDLLLTDLAMPVMSGIELIRVVRERFRRIPIAVLTLHQDFEYIQEALRAGAIDYIAKVQLEKERFEEVLGRIAARIAERGATDSGSARAGGEEQLLAADRALVLVGSGPSADSGWIERAQLSLDGTQRLQPLDHRLWFGSLEAGDAWTDRLVQAAASREDGWLLLRLSGLAGVERTALRRLLREYAATDAFYDYDPDPNRRMMVCDYAELAARAAEQDEGSLRRVTELWKSPDWLFEDAAFDSVILQARSSRIPPIHLIGSLYVLANEWNRMFAQGEADSVEVKGSFAYWHQVESWLRELRDAARRRSNKTPYSREIADTIMRAIPIMQAELSEQLTLNDIAKRLNISRSYFSQCFKEIVGKTFNEYHRFLRIEKAKEYLQYSGQPIHAIADLIGYADEKYFSRVFREETGMLPSEYRAGIKRG